MKRVAMIIVSVKHYWPKRWTRPNGYSGGYQTTRHQTTNHQKQVVGVTFAVLPNF
ncbi:MAG: hypothetical protein QME81_05065 [bacterium]|nr:hypothetical protein [bacterium]